jgi:YggT family protein
VVFVLGFLDLLLQLFLYFLLARLILEYVRMFARSWRPKGVVLVLITGVYLVTDKPLDILRRRIPPLRMGGISLDLSFLVLFVIVSVLRSGVRILALL